MRLNIKNLFTMGLVFIYMMLPFSSYSMDDYLSPDLMKSLKSFSKIPNIELDYYDGISLFIVKEDYKYQCEKIFTGHFKSEFYTGRVVCYKYRSMGIGFINFWSEVERQYYNNLN